MKTYAYILCLIGVAIAGFHHIALIPVLLIATVCADQICEAIKSNSDKDGKL